MDVFYKTEHWYLYKMNKISFLTSALRITGSLLQFWKSSLSFAKDIFSKSGFWCLPRSSKIAYTYAHNFFDREQRSKFLKEAFLLFLLLAWWKHEQKTFHIEQKLFAIKKLKKGKKMFAKNGTLRYYNSHAHCVKMDFYPEKNWWSTGWTANLWTILKVQCY